MDICGDDRFEIIAKAKAHLLEATNIDMSPKEMEVLDNFLFRCWQMGWLDRYAEQTEPQRGCDADCNEDCNDCARESELWKAEQTEPITNCDIDCSWK